MVGGVVQPRHPRAASKARPAHGRNRSFGLGAARVIGSFAYSNSSASVSNVRQSRTLGDAVLKLCIGLEYDYNYQNGCTETGGGAVNLQVMPRSQNTLQSAVGTPL